MAKSVAVVMGSKGDLPVAQKAIDELRAIGIPCEVRVISAHRTPQAAARYAGQASEDGVGVIIAIAGMAAHLAGVLASYTTLPVIGVPCAGGLSGGLDALLSTVQMPTGVPVATVAVGGGANAAILASQILALSDENLAARLLRRKQELADTVSATDAEIRENANNSNTEQN